MHLQVITLLAGVGFGAVCGFAGFFAYHFFALAKRPSVDRSTRYAAAIWVLLAFVAGAHAGINLWLGTSSPQVAQRFVTLGYVNIASGFLTCLALGWVATSLLRQSRR
ncbi:MAG: hypothetical protein Q4P06_03025 [Actinomycetaceae bacterium]|nr:hypothetical protein [Actinomycetaceae bacterium]